MSTNEMPLKQIATAERQRTFHFNQCIDREERQTKDRRKKNFELNFNRVIHMHNYHWPVVNKARQNH